MRSGKMGKRGMDERGAGSSGIAFFVIAIVAAVVVVFAIWVFSGGFGQITGGIEQLGGDIGKRAETCIKAQHINEAAWCEYSKLTDKDLEWANCAHPLINRAMRATAGFEFPKDFSCTGVAIRGQEVSICDKLKDEGKEFSKARFNGRKSAQC
jgi:hypothetical protein